MFGQTLFICLLANFYLAESVEIVVRSVLQQKGISTEAHDQKICDFWTREKLEAAKIIGFHSALCATCKNFSKSQ